MSESVLRSLGYWWTYATYFASKMSERVFDSQDSDEGSVTPVCSVSDAESHRFTKHVPRLRSTTEPDLSLRVASSEESISTGTKRLSRVECQPINTLRHTRHNSRPYTDIRWLQTGTSSADSKSTGTGDQDLDLYHSRNVLYTSVNEVARQGAIIKSPSTSHLHFVRNSGTQSKPYRYGAGRSTPQGSSNQNYSLPQAYSKPTCNCCENAKKSVRAESVLSLADDPETPEGLSWRRLHMSRAKLKATATTSELLSGFAMVAMVELQINKPTAVPEWLFVTFAVCTTILVSVHIFALMISTYLLPSIDAVSKLHVSSLVTESPHDRMKSFIELAWAFSTILGLLLFLVEIAILCWVKFWDYSFTAAMSATMIVIPVLVIFVAFAMHFYHSLVVIKCKTSVSNIQELENMKKQLDNVTA